MRQKVRTQLEKANLQGKAILIQPVWVRIYHWGFALSITGIILTGFELHRPLSFLAFNYGRVYIVHMTSAWLAMAFVALRLADALLSKDTSLIPRIADLKNFPKLMTYYFFLRSTPPPAGKYNSGQKLVYMSWFIVFSAASFLGLTSYWMGEHLVWASRLVGGWQVVRTIKFISAIYFSATIPLHIYLSVTEDISRLQAMLTGYERQKP